MELNQHGEAMEHTKAYETDYERRCAPLRAEYKRQVEALEAEFNRKRTLLLEEFSRRHIALLDELEREEEPLRTKRKQRRAELYAALAGPDQPE